MSLPLFLVLWPLSPISYLHCQHWSLKTHRLLVLADPGNKTQSPLGWCSHPQPLLQSPLRPTLCVITTGVTKPALSVLPSLSSCFVYTLLSFLISSVNCLFYFFIWVDMCIYLCVCMHMSRARMWRLEDTLVSVVSSFNHTDPENLAQVVRLGGRVLLLTDPSYCLIGNYYHFPRLCISTSHWGMLSLSWSLSLLELFVPFSELCVLIARHLYHLTLILFCLNSTNFFSFLKCVCLLPPENESWWHKLLGLHPGLCRQYAEEK